MEFFNRGGGVSDMIRVMFWSFIFLVKDVS